MNYYIGPSIRLKTFINLSFALAMVVGINSTEAATIKRDPVKRELTTTIKSSQITGDKSEKVWTSEEINVPLALVDAGDMLIFDIDFKDERRIKVTDKGFNDTESIRFSILGTPVTRFTNSDLDYIWEFIDTNGNLLVNPIDDRKGVITPDGLGQISRSGEQIEIQLTKRNMFSFGGIKLKVTTSKEIRRVWGVTNINLSVDGDVIQITDKAGTTIPEPRIILGLFTTLGFRALSKGKLSKKKNSNQDATN